MTPEKLATLAQAIFFSSDDLAAFIRAHAETITILPIHPLANGSGEWVLFYAL